MCAEFQKYVINRLNNMRANMSIIRTRIKNATTNGLLGFAIKESNTKEHLFKLKNSFIVLGFDNKCDMMIKVVFDKLFIMRSICLLQSNCR